MTATVTLSMMKGLAARLLSHHYLIDSNMPLHEFDEAIERTAFIQVIDNIRHLHRRVETSPASDSHLV